MLARFRKNTASYYADTASTSTNGMFGIENERLELNRALQGLCPFIVEIPGGMPQAMDETAPLALNRNSAPEAHGAN